MDVVSCRHNERLRIALDNREIKARSFPLSSLLPQNKRAASNALVRLRATFFYFSSSIQHAFFYSLLSSLRKDLLRPEYVINFNIRSCETQPVDHEYPFSKESVHKSPSNFKPSNAVFGDGKTPPLYRASSTLPQQQSPPIMAYLSANSHEGRASTV